jgi:predicted nicotinamide N-methyase
MFSIKSFFQQYETEKVSLTIQNKPFSFLIPKKLDQFIDEKDVLKQFPLWAKIWESSLVLSDYLVSHYKSPKRILELGAGLGVNSIIASSLGHQVTLTEFDPHAFQFAQANASINSCHTIDFKMLDWQSPDVESKFDMIVGSELIDKESVFAAMSHFFHHYLLNDGEIILANELRKTSKLFFDTMTQTYNIQIWRKKLRASDKEKTILLSRFTVKDENSAL